LWSKSRAKGLTEEETLASLNVAEAKTLARDRHSTLIDFNQQN